jgi:hypothetical protein
MSIMAAPVFEQQKNQPRLFQDRGWPRLKVLCLLLVPQHIFFARRRPALPVKEGAERKGEVEKCASVTHDEGYYRPARKTVSRDFNLNDGACA